MTNNRISRRLERIRNRRALSKRQCDENGKNHEEFLYQTSKELLGVLLKHFSYYVLEAKCYHSGRHDPGRGHIDREDHDGVDVTVWMKTQPQGTSGNLEMGKILYDAKGSPNDVVEFNKNIFLTRSQKMARLKKAIWSHYIYRTRTSLMSEILTDMKKVNFIPSVITLDKVLKHL